MVDALALDTSAERRGGSTPLIRTNNVCDRASHGTKLFLDDIRPAPDATWTIARSYDEAVAIVDAYGFPDTVSFDHDLGEDTMTGVSFARFLVDLDLDKATMPASFTYTVHSANPVGRDNIVGLLDRYLRWKKDQEAPGKNDE